MNEFIPGTMARPIGDGVFFRPIKSWHSGTYAGEGLYSAHDDSSGCLVKGTGKYRDLAYAPLTVTHRVYWHERDPSKTVSSFLSYPEAMGCCETYFWEIYAGDETPRFATEEEMETAVKEWLQP